MKKKTNTIRRADKKGKTRRARKTRRANIRRKPISRSRKRLRGGSAVAVASAIGVAGYVGSRAFDALPPLNAGSRRKSHTNAGHGCKCECTESGSICKGGYHDWVSQQPRLVQLRSRLYGPNHESATTVEELLTDRHVDGSSSRKNPESFRSMDHGPFDKLVNNCTSSRKEGRDDGWENIAKSDEPEKWVCFGCSMSRQFRGVLKGNEKEPLKPSREYEPEKTSAEEAIEESVKTAGEPLSWEGTLGSERERRAKKMERLRGSSRNRGRLLDTSHPHVRKQVRAQLGEELVKELVKEPKIPTKHWSAHGEQTGIGEGYHLYPDDVRPTGERTSGELMGYEAVADDDETDDDETDDDGSGAE